MLDTKERPARGRGEPKDHLVEIIGTESPRQYSPDNPHSQRYCKPVPLAWPLRDIMDRLKVIPADDDPLVDRIDRAVICGEAMRVTRLDLMDLAYSDLSFWLGNVPAIVVDNAELGRWLFKRIVAEGERPPPIYIKGADHAGT